MINKAVHYDFLCNSDRSWMNLDSPTRRKSRINLLKTSLEMGWGLPDHLEEQIELTMELHDIDREKAMELIIMQLEMGVYRDPR